MKHVWVVVNGRGEPMWYGKSGNASGEDFWNSRHPTFFTSYEEARGRLRMAFGSYRITSYLASYPQRVLRIDHWNKK